MRRSLFFLAILFYVHPAIAQTRQHNHTGDDNLILLKNTAVTPLNAAKTTAGTGPIFDTSRWRHAIDSTWGHGIPDAEKLQVFDEIWHALDSAYDCFVHLPMYDWDMIVHNMRTEIAGGVSRGRFASIVGTLQRYINDAHTEFFDIGVLYGSYIYPGKPVFSGESGNFGACLTPIYDTLPMVYDVMPGHPFGLQPGDVILGYNGMSWASLVRTMIKYELPYSVLTGSTDSATLHRCMQAAGDNWYLFDTINIQKCDGSVVNFPTSLMMGTYLNNLCTEQMPVPGVHRITSDEYYFGHKYISANVVAGTHIGYIYMLNCHDGSGDSLYNVVKALVEDSMVTSIILDIRRNFGGSIGAFMKAFKYLHNGNVTWVKLGHRVSTADRYLMHHTSDVYDLADTDPHTFSGPIAILSGPSALSAGDFIAPLFRHQPNTRIFGKSTAGAFGANISIPLSDTACVATIQVGNFTDISDTSNYLTHTMYPVDVKTWFKRSSVCAGKDNMVAEAIEWIKGELPVTEQQLAAGVAVFPNPADGYINISVSAAGDDRLQLRIYNMLGAVVEESSHIIHSGNNNVRINMQGKEMPQGTYYIMLQSGYGDRVIKPITIIHQ